MFSSTVSDAKSLVIWNVRAMPREARWCGASVVMSDPRKLIEPSVGRTSPLIRLNSVVLPAPFGPITARRSPG